MAFLEPLGWVAAAVVILIFNLLMVIFAMSEGMDGLDEFFNPKTLYKMHKVNVFGSIILTIFWNIVFAPHALYFWFYKLCTVGRDK